MDLRLGRYLLAVIVTVGMVLSVFSHSEAAEAQFLGREGKKGCRFTLELARTPGEQNKGLMFRDSLPADRGMLFVFDGDGMRNFWMLNTRIPLDMIFIDSGFKVVHVHHQAVPHDTTAINSRAPARYVLEVIGGRASQCSIETGAKVKFTGLSKQ
jgi:uncharacterized membrane protein (UPF0127 family)